MLRFLTQDDLARDPALATSMFRHRAEQFHRRRGWDVAVNDQGEERDAYDAQGPLYVIWQVPDGSHGGSMRLLPTTGRTMVNDHFTHLIGGGTICSPLIWECTRFCLAPGAHPRVAAALMLGGGVFMQASGVRHFVGVFDAPMTRIYRTIGAEPDVMGSEGAGAAKTSVGLWTFSETDRARISRRAGIAVETAEAWFAQDRAAPRALIAAE